VNHKGFPKVAEVDCIDDDDEDASIDVTGSCVTIIIIYCYSWPRSDLQLVHIFRDEYIRFHKRMGQSRAIENSRKPKNGSTNEKGTPTNNASDSFEGKP